MPGCASVMTMGAFEPAVGFLGDPGGIVSLANTQVSTANSLALSLASIASSFVAPTISTAFPDSDVAPAISIPDLPSFDDVVWISPSIPAVFTGAVDVEGLMPAPFDEDAPTLSFLTAPARFSDPAPTSPAVNTSFADPTLSLTLPTAPDLLAISVAPFGGVTMPTFSATDPTLSVVAPSIREYTPGALYTSSLLTALSTSLQERITTGGTGLNADVENAIWERGREREAKSQRDALAKLDQMESLGYAFPPGVYLDARVKIITETDYAERGYSREVLIKSAELELDNVKHALTTATSVESMLVNYTNQVEQRLFESTKYATEAGIAIYNAQVQAFASLVEVYKTKVQIYEAEIRAQLALVDVYKAQIEAEQTKAQVNTALVEQYKVQAEIAAYSIDIYKAQLSGIQTKAEIEKLKVEIFGEQVRAYATRVNAYTADVEGFRAGLEAEKTKQEVYQSQVDAFSAQVTAAAKQIDARVSVYRSQIEAKNIEWEGYKATVQGESARVDGLVKGNQALADVYKAQVGGYASFNDTLTKQWNVVLDQNNRIAEISIQAAKANAELYVSGRSLASDAAKVGAQVTAQLGAAALNAVNWSNSLSQSFGNSNSFQMQASQEVQCATHYNYSGSI